VHQAFVSGRDPGMQDVFIDSAGATSGILVYLGLSRIKKNVINNRKTCKGSSNFNCQRI
jgi:VanZ family protein